MNDNVLIIQCFDRWWVYDQSIYEDPPKIPSDILELASIVYYVRDNATIKNRFNANFKDILQMRLWLGESWPNIEDRQFRDVYVDYITKLSLRMDALRK